MKKPITAMEPQRDQCGCWTHPDFFVPADEREYPLPGEFEAWLEENHLAGRLKWMSSDVTIEQQEAYDAGSFDVSEWTPIPPGGSGWFIGSIHDTEDGPVCYWLRHVEQDALTMLLAKLKEEGDTESALADMISDLLTESEQRKAMLKFVNNVHSSQLADANQRIAELEQRAQAPVKLPDPLGWKPPSGQSVLCEVDVIKFLTLQGFTVEVKN
jgi:hypothetical protein